MIGLIFGETNFPKRNSKVKLKKNLKYLIIDLTKKKNLRKICILIHVSIRSIWKNNKNT